MIEQILAELELASLNAFQSDGNRITLSNTAIDIVVHESVLEVWTDGKFVGLETNATDVTTLAITEYNKQR